MQAGTDAQPPEQQNDPDALTVADGADRSSDAPDLAELRHSHRLLSHFFGASPALLCIADTQGRLVRVSQAMARLLGYEQDEIVGRFIFDFIHEDDRDNTREALRRLVGGGDLRDFVNRYICKDGGFRWLSWDAQQGGEDGTLFGIAVDITQRMAAIAEQHRLETELRQAQKLEAIGTLASGMAHDFSNMITVVFGYTDLMRTELADDSPLHVHLDAIEKVASRATGVTNSLLTFSQRRRTERQTLELRELVVETLRLLRRVLPASVAIEEDVADGSPVWINGDAAQLQQVLMNLSLNARDAMPDGGKLSVEIDTVPADGRSWAQLTVTDSGPGIDEQTQARIFEPFFTTKPRGQGTGLGLSVVHGIVQDHGGTIVVHSAAGKGARFEVRLPAVNARSAPKPKADATRKGLGEGEAVLVVEDDAFVRSIVTSALESEGFAPLVAEDGREGVEVFNERSDDIRLMIVDMDLPRLSGSGFLREIQPKSEGIPVIVVSGNPAQDLPDDLESSAVQLNKPFQIGALISLVNQALGKLPAREIEDNE